MTTRLLTVSLVAGLALAAGAAAAQDRPPEDAMPLSEVLAMLEAGGDVAYFDEIEWDDDGYWEVSYYRADGSEVSVDLDPSTGEPRN